MDETKQKLMRFIDSDGKIVVTDDMPADLKAAINYLNQNNVSLFSKVNDEDDGIDYDEDNVPSIDDEELDDDSNEELEDSDDEIEETEDLNVQDLNDIF